MNDDYPSLVERNVERKISAVTDKDKELIPGEHVSNQ